MRVNLIVFFVLMRTGILCAQSAFVPNEGQWNEKVLFQSHIQGGNAFLRENAITYAFYDKDNAMRIHEQLDSVIDVAQRDAIEQSKINCYAYEVSFLNADARAVEGSVRLQSTQNYFIGNDTSKWASGLPMFSSVNYTDLYDGIDVIFHNTNSLKYDYVLDPYAAAEQIQLQYNGHQSLQVVDGELLIGIGFAVIREVIPAAYQIVNGKKQFVKCEYRLDGNIVSFHFPDGYDQSFSLVIDPEVIASTYSGSTAMAFGFTATYDEAGNIYGGGTVFDIGFPVTLGAYDLTYAGVYDIGINKFDPTGSNLIFCTYLGGVDIDYPLSMYDFQGTLYVFGCTVSPDFPSTAGAYDPTFNGQTDIVVFSLANNGSNLSASTFVGGSGHDGKNVININPGDGYRGEIVLDENGNVYIASCTSVSGFPVTAGAYQTTSAGSQDAVIFKMNAALSTLIWSTYLGCSQHDVALGIRTDNAGNVYVCGGARSVFLDFPVVSGCYQTTYNGGACDAFIAKFDPTGANLIACTFYGGGNHDMAYFIDLDSDGDVYITGESRMGAPVTGGIYNSPGSTNFIAKLDASLTTLLFSTVIGDGNVYSFVVPSAFMVDNCKRIFIGGFGGSADLPLTSDALYTWSVHNRWYLAAFTANMESLLFATSYGSWHVDGGTSRFDPKGVVYQCVCSDSAEFPVVPWAYSDSSNSHMWDICVFKIDFEIERDTLLLPNVFTPNGDGINDLYDVSLAATDFYEQHIYDRWGVEVFSSTNVSEKWDGKFNGKECEEGVYYVTVKHGYCSGEPYTNTGFLHLSRNKR